MQAKRQDGVTQMAYAETPPAAMRTPDRTVPARVPIGSLVAGTPVLTLDGELPVQYLAPGDRVVTRTGATEILTVEVDVLYAAQMIRIAPAALNHGRPDCELFLSPAQPLALPEATGRTPAAPGCMVAAETLAGQDFIRAEQVAEVRVFRLHFAEEQVVYAAGVELLSPVAGSDG
jgi:hypothetical protein